jgi:putative hemolysin
MACLKLPGQAGTASEGKPKLDLYRYKWLALMPQLSSSRNDKGIKPAKNAMPADLGQWFGFGCRKYSLNKLFAYIFSRLSITKIMKYSMPVVVAAFLSLAVAGALSGMTALATAQPVSKAPNYGGIANTRHNLTQSFLGESAGWMSMSRNNYGEVCVYCHTPHGANTNVAVPLWNRTIRQTTYTTYDKLATTAEQTYSQPGAASLSCLSCHDGQTAMDSIINMPGAGGYNAGQSTAQNNGFLDAWPGGPGQSFYGGHGTLSNTPAALNNYGECQSCHSMNGDQHDPGYIPSFDVAFIGTDLRNDHPVGVTYPKKTGTGTDWKTPTGSKTVNGLLTSFFDTDNNDHMDKTDIRLYNTGAGPEVECASCHDPHGVPSGGTGSIFNKTFLRKTNEGSAVCQTCHSK